MKAVVNLAVAASVVAGVAADPHHHQHQHLHARKHAHSPVDKRAPAPAVYTDVVQGPTVTVYELDGQMLDAGQAAQGVKNGSFIVVGETKPSFTPPPPPPPPPSTTSAVASSTAEPAQFKQIELSTSSSPAPVATPAAASVASNGSSSSSGGAGLSAPFPNGQLDCTWANLEQYGARPLSWLGLGGFASIQTVNNGWSPGIAIETVVEQITGDILHGSFVSYACPSGYEKSQWPAKSQPSSGVSVGGVYCNTQGKFELTNPTYDTLCIQGAGGVYVRNEMSQQTCICQTNYPGDEKMSIDTCPGPQQTLPLTNVQSDYYQWQGKPTSGQFYANPVGLSAAEACVWTSPTQPLAAGNWAAINIGVGTDSHGVTYLSIFPNVPTTSAQPGYDIEIQGDVNAPCSLTGGSYTGGNPHGCTTSIKQGGTATFVLKSSS